MKPKYIICENKEERDAVLEKLERQGYVWVGEGEKPTEWNYPGWEDDESIYFNLSHSTRKISWGNVSSQYFLDEPEMLKITANNFLRNNKPILITIKGRVVTAENKNTGEKAIATCSPDDTFDFGTGAMIAVARLIAQSDKGITKDAETVLRQLLGDDVSSDSPADKWPTSKFKIGDIVTLKDGLEVGKPYGAVDLLEIMYSNGYGKQMKVVDNIKCEDGDMAYDCAPIGGGRSFWYVEEMLEPWDESKIREGDIVRVVSTGKTFDTYFEWVARNVEEKNLIARFKCDCLPPITNNYEVVKIAPHGDCSELLAYIKSTATNRCYVVGINGLEKVTEE